MINSYYVDCEQGSPEWHVERAGLITASMVSTVRKLVGGLNEQQQKYVDLVSGGADPAAAAKDAGYKKAPSSQKLDDAIAGKPCGEYGEAALNYAFRLACERISGLPLDEGFQTYQMKRGNELEPEARSRHEFEIGCEVIPTGMVKSLNGKFGASADGLIGEDGGAEYKCLVSPERIRSVLIDGDMSEFTDQVQACLWLTGRKWWHFVLYCPALEPAGKDITVYEVQRDDKYILKMESDLIAFDQLVCEYVGKIKSSKSLRA
jgi:hypothetical protein